MTTIYLNGLYFVEIGFWKILNYTASDTILLH